jgi:hypothetical protein
MLKLNETRRAASEFVASRRIAERRTVLSASALLAIAAAAAAVAPATYAQPPGNPIQQPQQERADAVERLTDRVAALERFVASMDTRFSAAQEMTRLPEFGRPVAIRIDTLERQVAQLTLDLQRLQSAVDRAMRAADNAQRSALQAESSARDALFRASQ